MSLLALSLLLAVGVDSVPAPPVIVPHTALVCAAPDDRRGPPADTTACVRTRITAVDPQQRALWMIATVALPEGLGA
ncbi:MAG: hypothetical protein MUE41_08105, partial [Gemmatimonadaceae bacterium]|nr:hypothetical protein [Gemmatimonadaceae bacterium]